jgi:hypothetical protein
MKTEEIAPSAIALYVFIWIILQAACAAASARAI